MKDFDLILVDGSGYLFRAFHALPPLTNHKGQPTGAIYGVLNMIRRLKKMHEGVEMIVFFDPPGPTVRHSIYAAYKANRGKMPDDLRVQIEPLHQILRAQGLPLCIVPEQEADDVIGTVACAALAKGKRVLISTQDKDFAQLVRPGITLIDTMHSKQYDADSVYDKYQVPPERIIDYLALIGDSSDNIPGVMKVGPKTAVKWLQAYGDLDGIMQHADSIGGKVGENLRASLSDLPLYRQLVTINTDLELPIDWQNLVAQSQSLDDLRDYYREMGFRSWYQELNQPDLDFVKSKVVCIDNVHGCQDLLKKLQSDDLPIACSLFFGDPLGRCFDVKGMGLCHDGVAYYIPLVTCTDHSQHVPWKVVSSVLKPLWQDASKTWFVFQLKHFLRALSWDGNALAGEVFDVALLHYICYGPGASDLSQMAMKALGLILPERGSLFGKGAKTKCVEAMAIAELLAQQQAEQGALMALGLHYQAKMAHDAVMADIYAVDFSLAQILAKMEDTGVLIDVGVLALQAKDLSSRIQELELQAHALAGHPFNLSSPKQLQTILYDVLHIPILEKTPTGMPSTSESTLQRLSENHALPECVLSYRSLFKLQSTYVEALPKMLDDDSGRIHSRFLQTSTSTGRLSSQNPNLQNIPIRTEEGRRIRKAFIASDGCVLVALDYSQVELRIMAHISEDETLLRAFSEGIDVHTQTAADIFGVSIDRVDAEQRRYAKVINFGLIYGMSAFGLAKQLQIGRDEASRYIDAYFARYQGVARYMDACRAQASQQGYVETLLGRKIFFPDIASSQASLRRASERAAINAPMQGTAAELIKLAMRATDTCLQPYGGRCRLILQVHDELVFEVPDDLVEEVLPKLIHAMEHAMALAVPLEVSSGVGHDWGSIH